MKNVFQTGLFCLLFLILSLGNSWAQASHLRFEHLTVNQGLSNSIIHAMLQDHNGYLWFATENGLNKYNGYTFKTYQKIPGDTTSLVNNVIYHLIEDKDGNIWAGMVGQGICKFDPHTEKFTCYGPTKGTLSEGTIYTMGEDREGYIWVSNWRDELRRFDKKSGRFSSFNYATLLAEKNDKGQIITPIVNGIFSDRSGIVWVCSERGLHRMNLKPTGLGKPSQVSFTTYRHDPANVHSLSPGQVWRVYEDHAGMLWISTQKGMNRFNRTTETFTHYQYSVNPSPAFNASINQSFLDIAEDKQGNIWLGTPDFGLFKLDPVTEQFTQLLPDPVDAASLSSIHIRSLLIDQSGLMWVGTWGEGIDKANPGQQAFTFYRPLPYHPHSLSYKFVSFILEDRSGTVWVGTGDGLNRMNKQTGEFTHYRHDPTNPKSLPNRNAEAMLEDREGNLWVASHGDLCLFNRQTGEFNCISRDTRRYPGLGDNRQIFTIYQDRQRMLWLGTTNGVKYFNPKTGKVIHYSYNPKDPTGISEALAISMLEDNRGNFWIGTESIALNRLDRKTGRFTHYRPDKYKSGSISSDGVLSIFQDKKSNLWFGTSGGGLCRFDYEKETFQVFTTADGLADNSVFSIDQDNQGQLWLGTFKGLSRFSFETRTFHNYEISDGLQNNGFRQPHCKGKEGMLYFGGDNGFAAFDPSLLTINQHIPPIVFTQAKLFDNPITRVEDSSKIDLAYNENFLSFEFAALDYANPSKNQYAYQLVGLDKNWIYSGTRRYITYTNLDPGTYVLRVKGSNNDGVWNQKGASIRLIIAPPWWQTWWAYSVYVLLLGGLIWGLIRFYTNRIRQKQELELNRREAEQLKAVDELKTRFFSNITHEFRTPLSLIISPVEKLLRESRFDRQALTLVQRSADQLLRLINQLLDLSKLEANHMTVSLMRGEIPAFVNYVVDSFRQAAKQKGVALSFISEDLTQEQLFDADKWEKILTNFLSNALKFTKAGGHVTVTLKPNSSSVLREVNSVEIQIEDSGIGIAPEKLPHIFDRFYQVDNSHTRAYEGTGIGLSLAKELVDLIGGTINVSSQPEVGTTFVLILPVQPVSANTEAPTVVLTDTKQTVLNQVSATTSDVPRNQSIDNEKTSRILIVEDNRELREFLVSELAASYPIFSAADGEAGWQLAQSELPDIVIADVMMPRMDGYELTRRIKSHPDTNHIAVVMLTAKAAHSSRIEGLQEGADDYLAKPFNLDELHLRLHNLTTRQQKLRDHYRQQFIRPDTPAPLEMVQDSFLLRIYELLEKHLDDTSINVDWLADQLAMSRKTLYRKIHSLIQLAPNELIRQYRLRKAADLLRAGHAVTETADLVGFKTPAHFTIVFKEFYQKTPSEFIATSFRKS